MSFWSAVGSWAMGQFTSNFLGGKSGGGNGSAGGCANRSFRCVYQNYSAQATA